MVRVNCDIHADMLGYILVLPHPFFARPGSDGNFRISGVPAGKYHLVAWHDTLAPQVRQVTGFEFFQDVDGDFVFKPPYYNLDTSNNRVFVVKDIDIINITFTEAEPEVTSLVVKSGQFANIGGLNLEGNEYGTRGEYIDYRLVAKFGWRQDSFESAYLTNPKALFYACVSRMDLFNLNMTRANCQIPLRPELRPGYPVYLESFDCFYYLVSFSHTFNFNGQCTTNLTLNGRRAKFYAPGLAPQDGSKATIGDIKLSDPWLPPLPLEVEGNDGIPRLQGFPNVVMAIDTDLLNPNYFSVGLNLDNLDTEAGIQSLIRKAKDFGVLEIDEENAGGKSEREKWLSGPFQVRTGRNTVRKVGTAQDLLEQAKNYSAAYSETHADPAKDKGIRATLTDAELAKTQAADVQAIFDAILEVSGNQTGIEDGDQTANYLDMLNDLKASFNPGSSMPGYYRYYSSSHPDEEQQGMREVDADDETSGTTQSAGLVYLETTTSVLGFPSTGDTRLETIEVKAGIPIMRPNTGARNARAVPTPTHQIGTLSFAQTFLTKQIEIPQVTTQREPTFSKDTIHTVIWTDMLIVSERLGFGSTVADRFQEKYNEYGTAITTTARTLGQTATVPSFTDALAQVKGDKPPYRRVAVDVNLSVEDQFKAPNSGLVTINNALVKALQKPAVAIFQARYNELVASVGPPGSTTPVTGASGLGIEDGDFAVTNASAYIELEKQWADFIVGLAGEDRVAAPYDSDGGGLKVFVTRYNNAADQYTPVFPVSDERGYEVIGSYRYGRGLSVEVGGNMEQMHNVDPFELVDVEAIDAFNRVKKPRLGRWISPSTTNQNLSLTDPSPFRMLSR